MNYFSFILLFATATCDNKLNNKAMYNKALAGDVELPFSNP